MFQGDIAQFAPTDLLLFLCHMNKTGVLTVRQDETVLTLSFRGNLIVDAGSDAAERLILEMLEYRKAATADALAYLRRVREETGLPLTQILENVQWLSLGDVGDAMSAGLREVVFQLMLMDHGAFQFTEIDVDRNPHLTPTDGQALVMDLTREVDEYRELVRGLGSLDRRGKVATRPAKVTAAQRYVLTHAGDSASVRDLMATAPFPRLAVAAAVSTAVGEGWLALVDAPPEPVPGAGAPGDGTSAFRAYRRSLRRLLQAADRQAGLRELLDFARHQCTRTILMAVRDGRLRRATVYDRDGDGRLTASDHRELSVELATDPVFAQVLSAGRPFVGAAFTSPVLAALDADGPAVDCALLPLGRMGDNELLMHAVTAEPGGPRGPLACLELLSWQIRVPRPDTGSKPEPAAPSRPRATDASDDAAAAGLVASIKDLPPMSHVVARILDLLADPDCDVHRLTEALSREPALVARLIKVSNSSLYGGYQETGSLNQAIVRLGTRTTRSVVMAASTRSLFPTDNTRVGLFGRELWQHAVQTGLAARRVAEFTRRADPDEAFAAGVLHDVGKVVILLNHPESYTEIRRRLDAGAPDSVSVERELLGYDHGLVGDRLLESWGMPGNLRAVVRGHHAPEAAGDHAPLVLVVACADLMSHDLVGSSGGGRIAARLDAACEALGLDAGARTDLASFLEADVEQGDLLD